MNAIRAALDKLPGGKNILMYGEPWQGGATRMEEGAVPADKNALPQLDGRIGIFCDNTRDTVKGGVFDARSPGYVNGAPGAGYTLLHAVGAFRDGPMVCAPKIRGRSSSMSPPTTTSPCGTNSRWWQGDTPMTSSTATCWPRTACAPPSA